MRLISYNIRVDIDSADDWQRRAGGVAHILTHHKPDVVGLQEARRHQIDDLERRLAGYRWIGEPRDPDDPEFVPIFYNPAAVRLLSYGHFWLSPTPDRCSRGWDARYKRIVTWAHCRGAAHSIPFWLFNTHFDHLGSLARRKSAKLLLKRIDMLTARGDHVVVCGDINCGPNSRAYRRLDQRLPDANRVAIKGSRFGWTHRSFGIVPRHIDHVFVSPRLFVERYKILADKVHGDWPSDHLPVRVDFYPETPKAGVAPAVR